MAVGVTIVGRERTGVSRVGNRLYERTAETTAIDDLVALLGQGRGGAVMIEARAGVGKSSLVEYAVDGARALGARIVVARARHLESAAPFEVLRRLLGPAVEELGGADALTGAAAFAGPLFTPGAEATAGVDYGCQWLIARLAEQTPLVLAVDDAHWADAASLRVLLEVQAEISVQPVLLVLASRPVENPEAQRRLATMAAQPDCELLTPAPLTRTGIDAVITDVFGAPAHELFVDDVLTVSGGNAFYLHELLRAYQSDFRPDLQAIVRKGNLSLRRTMSWRLGELGFAAAALAQAAAILGDGCSLPVAAALAGLDDQVAVGEAARLVAASVFTSGDPVDFVHPLIRAAVEETLTEVEIGELHARAGRLLLARHATSAEVVPHLVASPASGDAQVSTYLIEQGEAALENGAVAVAAELLQRGLDEPPPASERARVLVLLARAEHATGSLDRSAQHLEAALADGDRQDGLAAAAELVDVLGDAGDFAALARLLRRVLTMRPFGNSEPEVRLKAQLITLGFMGLENLPDLPDELRDVDAAGLPVDRGVDRFLLVAAAIHERTLLRGSTARLEANLRRAVASLPDEPTALTDWDVQSALMAATFLADDALEETDAVLERIAPAVARLGGAFPVLQADLDHRRSVGAMRKGDFEDALSRVADAERFTTRHGLTGFEGAHRFTRGWIALEKGDYSTAGSLLRERIGEDNVFPALGALLSGRPQEAVALLEEFGFAVDPQGDIRPIEVELDPHLVASHAYECAGDPDRAAREAERELAIRRTYGPKFRLALALRRTARFQPARRAVPLLEEAVVLADSTPRRPVQVRVLADYGAALRRSGDHPLARDVLYRAADGAAGMGMEAVRRRAQDELRLAGGRPRRARRTGPTSLTEAQRQVAGLATRGRTNREIAEELFVTIKTVETHLAATYRKLGISCRVDLASALGDGDPTAVGAGVTGGRAAP